MITVLCNGVFDILHIGHVQHLREARAMGGKLVVALTADAFVNKGEGKPVNTWKDRAEMLRALRCVDDVISTDSAVAAIARVAPDFFVKGIDYADGKHFTENIAQACEEVGAHLCYTSTAKRSAAEWSK